MGKIQGIMFFNRQIPLKNLEQTILTSVLNPVKSVIQETKKL